MVMTPERKLGGRSLLGLRFKEIVCGLLSGDADRGHNRGCRGRR